jgi:outer membrane immunogenic protein
VRKILVAGIAMFSLCSGASAEDVASAAIMPPVVVPVYNWTGFYAGGNVGQSSNKSAPISSTVFSPNNYLFDVEDDAYNGIGRQNIRQNSITRGFTAGINLQVYRAVFGIEADINDIGFKGNATATTVYPDAPTYSFTVNSSVSAEWLATIRGRAGVLITPNFLVYATGGTAIADVKASFSFSDTFSPATESAAIQAIRHGWTAGAGVEAAIGNGWSLKAEYLYVDLGHLSATSTNLTAQGTTWPDVFTHSLNLNSTIVRIGANYKIF